jgi:hypothetical protein
MGCMNSPGESVMNNTIANSAFSLTRRNENAYDYTTCFLNSKDQVVSTKTVTFNKPPLVNGGRILDIYSQNGTCLSGSKENVTDGSIFGEEDRRAMVRTVKKMAKIHDAVNTLVMEGLQSKDTLFDRVVLVLDLHDQDNKYCDESLIKSSEEAVCNYLMNDLDIQEPRSQSTPVSPESLLGLSDDRSPMLETQANSPVLDQSVCSPSSPPTPASPEKLLRRSNYLANTIHRICRKTLSIDDIFCEGSLKVQLMKGLSKDQQEYFSKHPQEFCEYTEPFITAFKLGHEVNDIPNPQQFFKNISNRGVFKPGSVSTTWYPKSYIKLYGPNGRIPTAMSNVLSLSSKEDSTFKIFSTTVKEDKM